MAYCFVLASDGSPSIETALGTRLAAQLSGDKDGASIDETFWDEIVQNAERYINGKCRRLYTVPFVDPDVPLDIQALTVSISIGIAYEAKGGGASKMVIDRMERANKTLDEIAKGTYVLDVKDTAAAVPTVTPAIPFQAKARLFGRES